MNCFRVLGCRIVFTFRFISRKIAEQDIPFLLVINQGDGGGTVPETVKCITVDRSYLAPNLVPLWRGDVIHQKCFKNMDVGLYR
jgi:hypothetical protein